MNNKNDLQVLDVQKPVDVQSISESFLFVVQTVRFVRSFFDVLLNNTAMVIPIPNMTKLDTIDIQKVLGVF